MGAGETLGFDNAPKSAFVVAAILALTVVYAILQIGFVRPYLPADTPPNLARPPVSAGASEDALRAWRAEYHSGPGHKAHGPADPRTQGPADQRTQFRHDGGGRNGP